MGLAAVPAPPAAADPLDGLIATPEPMPDPLPDSQRIPDPAPVPQLGEATPGVTDITTGDAATPEEAMANLVAIGGGGSVQIYAPGPERPAHVALVRPGDKAAFGTLSRSGAGWAGQMGKATVFFPRHLAADSGIGFSVPEGSMTVTPEGISKTTGQEHPVAINYTAAKPYTDYFYSLSVGGYKERVDLTSFKASSSLSWLASSSELSLSLDSGEILVSAASGPVGFMPVPVISDQEGSAVVGTYGLSSVSSSITRISLQVPASFLASATYPVSVDPGASSMHPLTDTYVDSASPSSSFEGLDNLKVGPGRRAFLRFDTSSLQVPGRLVYQANVMVHASTADSAATVAAQQVTAAWPPAPMTWNNQPASSSANIDSSSATAGEFSTIHAKALYQGYLDGTATDQGIRLTSSSNIKFDSSEVGGVNRPALVLAFDDLPAAPVASGPTGGVGTEAPALEAAGVPADPNFDPVMLRFQLSNSPTDFSDAHILTQSNWSPEASYQVPAGLLLDGATYYWRIQARDVCDQQTGGLCDLTDGAGVVHAAPSSPVQRIDISTPRYGPTQTMSTQGIGNNISLGVDYATGNLYLDIPFDSRQSALGDISFGLSYNSQDPTDSGLGVGWRVYAGPPGELPIRIQSMQGGAYLLISLSDGSVRYFSRRAQGSDDYLSTGAGVGQITRNDDGTFTYEGAEGGSSYFGASGYLSTLRYPGTSPEAAALGKVLTYAFSGGHLASVTDPAGHAISFVWAGTTLDRVTTADGAVFDVNVSSGSIAVTNSAQETIQVLSPGGRASEVRDGAITAAGHSGWQITYDSSGRVASLKAPGGGAPSAPSPWTFTYAGPFHGQRTSVAYVTDPRGSATSEPNDFRIMYDLSTSGLPIRITGPADQNGYLPLETMAYDSNGNLVCERSPEANAVLPQTPTQCGDLTDTVGTDELSTRYLYSDAPPYRLTKTIGAAAGVGRDNPVYETSLDQGVPKGPLFSTYSNLDLSQVPRYSGTWNGPLSHDYGSTGSPPGIGAANNWAIRFSGYINNTSDISRNYRFRLYAQDGVRLVVNGTVLLSCFKQSTSATDYNCGKNNEVAIALPPGSWPISIRYSKLTHQGSFDFRWNAGVGPSVATIQAQDLASGLGLPSHSTSPAEGGSLTWDQNYGNGSTPASDASQITRLPMSADENSGGTHRVEATAYDSLGRLTQDTRAQGSPDEATTDYFYTDPATQCVTYEVDPEGATTERECNARGQVTSETTYVQDVFDQPAQDRTTTTTYDSMGRVISSDPPGDALTTYAYDRSGRMISEDRLLSTDGNVHAVTSYTFDDAGRMITQTNPDGGAVNYTWDWAGNQISSSDPRNPAWVTSTAYDAQGREIASITPSGLLSTTRYVLSEGGVYQNQRTQTGPDGVSTTTMMDALDQEVSSKTGSLSAATYVYDEVGNQIRMTDPSGVVTEDHYNAFGELSSTDTLVGPNPTRVTSYTYDKRGNQVSADGPRAGDTVSFTYDQADRLASVTEQGLPSPNETHYAYDDAGELVRVSQPMSSAQSLVRTFSYDERGNQDSSTDARGTTQMFYDAGGRLVRTLLPSGHEVDYDYDEMGNKTWRRFYDGWGRGCGICFSTYTYDLSGNMTSALRDGIGIDISHDSEGRISSVHEETSRIVDPSESNTSYSYSSTTGQLSDVATDTDRTAEREMSYAYNSNGLVSQVTNPFSGQPSTYGYDSAGRVITRSDPGGINWSRTYETATGLVSSQRVTGPSGQLASFGLSYDPAANVTSRTEVVAAPGGGNTPGSGTWSYGHDGAGRMTSATDPSGVTTTYGYDGAGNRTSVKVGSAAAVTTTYDDAGLPVSSSDGTTYTYEESANPAGSYVRVDKPQTAGDRCYFYDGFDNLHSVSLGDTTDCGKYSGDIVYYSDAIDRVFEKQGPSGAQLSFYEGMSSNLAATSSSPGDVSEYAYSSSGPFSYSSAAGSGYFINDLHGDVVGQVSASAMAGSKLYSPWGEPTAQLGQGSLLGFQGQPTDADTGLVKTGTRWYEPTMGRFQTKDVLFGDTQGPASLNQFGYAEGNPVTTDDPSGMRATCHADASTSGLDSAHLGWSRRAAHLQFTCSAPFHGYVGLVRLFVLTNDGWKELPTLTGDQEDNPDCRDKKSCSWTVTDWGPCPECYLKAHVIRVYVYDTNGVPSHAHFNFWSPKHHVCGQTTV